MASYMRRSFSSSVNFPSRMHSWYNASNSGSDLERARPIAFCQAFVASSGSLVSKKDVQALPNKAGR